MCNDIKNRQKDLLVLLVNIDFLLTNNAIKYSLTGGALLGAIRSEGFIPWDDDLDIVVDRNNFNKLKKLFKEKQIIGNKSYSMSAYMWIYRIQESNSVVDINKPTIDVFVLDNCPDNAIVSSFKLFCIMTLQGMMHKKVSFRKQSLFYSVCLFITYILGLVISDNQKLMLYERVSRIGNNRTCKYASLYNDLFKCLRIKYPSGILNEIFLHKFENLLVPIMTNYDEWLSIRYGDYMTPPPLEERKPNHMG